MKLYEYSENFAQLFDSLDAIADYEPQKNEDGQYVDDDGSVIPDIEAYKADMQTAWFDTLDAIEGEFELKAENIACYIKQVAGELEMLKKEKAAFERRRKSKENQFNSLKNYLLDCMQKIKRTKIETARTKISIRNNAESAQFENEKAFIQWAKKNADDLLNYGEPTIGKTAVKKALQDGRKLPGASLGRSQSLIIK